MKNNPVAKHAHKANKSAVMRDRKKDSKKGVVKHKGRDYAKEYANYHSDPEQIKRRAARNAARRALRGRKDLTDEKDVHHKDNNPMNNDKSNLSIVTQHYNRREPRLRMEDLRKWFGKGKKGDWVRVGTDGEIKGDCARDPGEGKPKCMPRSKAHSMKKKDRASSARRKRRADPDADRPGTGNKPIMVKTDKRESVEMSKIEEINEQKMDQKMFDSLKKGDKLSVSFGSGIRKDNKVTLLVKSKSKSAKYNLEKINCVNVNNPGGMKYTIYNRQGQFSLAQGNMATSAPDFVKESVELDEATKWKMGDGRPRNGARIENDRFWNLPKAQLMYIRKDASDAMKANPKGRKAGKYADEVNDAETVLGWRKKNGIRENAFVDALITKDNQMKDLQKEEYLDEKSVPTNPSLWSKFKSQAKAKFDVYPSAYANGWAAKQYKAAGGGWKNESVKENMTFSEMREARKPVSQMTPAEKKKDAERRKEYNAYQKSKFPTNTSATQGKRMGERESVEVEEGAEVYTVKKGTYTRTVDGATADRMKKDGWQLVGRSNEGSKVKFGPKPGSEKYMKNLRKGISDLKKKNKSKNKSK